MQSLVIVVLNWNQAALTISTVESILKSNLTNINLDVLVIDNCSKLKDYLLLKRKYAKSKKVKLYRLLKNRGYSGGNNYGIKKALKLKPGYIAVANNDIRLHENAIKILINTLQTHFNAFAIAPKIYFESGFEYFKSKYQPEELGRVIWAMGGKIDQNNVYGSNLHIDEVDNGQFEKLIINPDFLTGCFIIFKATIFNKIGLFNDDYYLYLEDMELSQKILRHGFDLLVEPSAKIWHLNSGSSSPKSNLHDYFLTRNRLIYGLSYSKFKTKFALFKESFSIFLKTKSYWQKRAILDFYLHRWGKGSWK